MYIRLSGVFLLVVVSIQNRATPADRCANADLSNLTRVVYVSPQGSDKTAGGCGDSKASPCETIQQGIKNCHSQNCSVLVRYGTYKVDEPIDLDDGVSLYGSCVFDETPYRYRSTIIGNPAMQANRINKPTVVEGFVILGSTATKSSGTSVAFLVSDSNGLVLRENVIASGKGGNGDNGSTPSPGGGQPGGNASATNGGKGGVACASNPPPGGLGSGGKGADLRTITSSCESAFGTCVCGDRPEAPRPVGGNGANSSSVAGGAGGGPGTPGCSCRISLVPLNVYGDAGKGSNGGSGNMGDFGRQGGSPDSDTKGSFSGTDWQPNHGGTGAAGKEGSGGGGGGAGGFAATTAKGSNINGFAGGGGGGGGCGGPGGTGGKQGGASVPLVLFASSVALAGPSASNAIIPGPGGQGGQGGIGALGGAGGSGGFRYEGLQTRYTVTVFPNINICSGIVPGVGGGGGNGGQGGAGAGGAGGNGGPSFGIALVNSPPLSASGLNIYPGQPARGGNAGPGGQNNGTNKGENGQVGLTGFTDSIVSFTSTNLPGANR